jgi:hypothetical protein
MFSEDSDQSCQTRFSLSSLQCAEGGSHVPAGPLLPVTPPLIVLKSKKNSKSNP